MPHNAANGRARRSVIKAAISIGKTSGAINAHCGEAGCGVPKRRDVKKPMMREPIRPIKPATMTSPANRLSCSDAVLPTDRRVWKTASVMPIRMRAYTAI